MAEVMDALDRLEINVCLRVNRIGRHRGVKAFFSVISRLGDYGFWLVRSCDDGDQSTRRCRREPAAPPASPPQSARRSPLLLRTTSRLSRMVSVICLPSINCINDSTSTRPACSMLWLTVVSGGLL